MPALPNHRTAAVPEAPVAAAGQARSTRPSRQLRGGRTWPRHFGIQANSAGFSISIMSRPSRRRRTRRLSLPRAAGLRGPDAAGRSRPTRCFLQVMPARRRDQPGCRLLRRSARRGRPSSPARASSANMRGRALLLVTGGCAVNCRYCFRREFPYAESGATRRGIAAGDRGHRGRPVALGSDPLRWRSAARRRRRPGGDRGAARCDRSPAAAADPHAAAGRAAEPGGRRARGDARPLAAGPVVVIHANHPAELDDAVAAAVRPPGRPAGGGAQPGGARCGASTTPPACCGPSPSGSSRSAWCPTTSTCSTGCGERPTSRSPRPRPARSTGRLQGSLPGYAVPRLVRETPGEPSKTWLA